MVNNTRESVSQCKCGTWFNNHESGKCKVCRQRKPKVTRKRGTTERKPVHGSLEWAEQRGGLIGGYEED